jgi:uncharacterized protein
MSCPDDNTRQGLTEGLERCREGEYFAAHEAFEAAWRLAPEGDRDFFQGLVHAVVFAYQSGRGRAVGAERQRVKALTRLSRYAACHGGVDLVRLRAALDRRETDLRHHLVECVAQPPGAVQEEQQPERHQC